MSQTGNQIICSSAYSGQQQKDSQISLLILLYDGEFNGDKIPSQRASDVDSIFMF